MGRRAALRGLAALAATAALIYIAAGGALYRSSVSGETWGKLRVTVVDTQLLSQAGLRGIELVYMKCSPLSCNPSRVESILLPAKPGAEADLGWAVLVNIGVRLGSGDYLPAQVIETTKPWLLNASWGLSLVRGYAVLRLQPLGVRVATPRCPHGLLWHRVPGAAGCVVEPSSPPLLSLSVDPSYGAEGGVVAVATASPILRVAAGAAAVLLAAYLLGLVRKEPTT